MKFFKKVWRAGNSLVITLDNGMIKGKDIKEKDEIEIEIKSIKKVKRKK